MHLGDIMIRMVKLTCSMILWAAIFFAGINTSIEAKINHQSLRGSKITTLNHLNESNYQQSHVFAKRNMKHKSNTNSQKNDNVQNENPDFDYCFYDNNITLFENKHNRSSCFCHRHHLQSKHILSSHCHNNTSYTSSRRDQNAKSHYSGSRDYYHKSLSRKSYDHFRTSASRNHNHASHTSASRKQNAESHTSENHDLYCCCKLGKGIKHSNEYAESDHFNMNRTDPQLLKIP